MQSKPLSIAADQGVAYQGQRAEHLRALAAPMDDMWTAFADMAEHFALRIGTDPVGSCSVDGEGRLLRFFVSPAFQHHSVALLRIVLTERGVSSMMVPSLDPNYLSSALELASRVEPHTLLFRRVAEPEVSELEGLRTGGSGDHERIVDFQEKEVGAPREFLEPYVGERLERGEILLLEDAAGIVAVGELRTDMHQAGVSHLGVVVRTADRRRGVGASMLASMVSRCGEAGRRPHCSTEVANEGARRAILRAGFRANHRLLRVGFVL